MVRELCSAIHVGPLVMRELVSNGSCVQPQGQFVNVWLEPSSDSVPCAYASFSVGENLKVFVLMLAKTIVTISQRFASSAPNVDVFNALASNIKNGPDRPTDTAQMFSHIVDAIADRYAALLNEMGDSIESVDARIASSPEVEQSVRQAKHYLRRNVLLLKKRLCFARDGAAAFSEDKVFAKSKLMMVSVRRRFEAMMETAETYEQVLALSN